MSCTVTPSTPSDVKIDIMMSNEAMNMYKRDYYGMTSCKVGYDYSYLADLKFLLEYSKCAQEACTCYCACSYDEINEKIQTL